MKGYIHSLQSLGTVDGPGVRAVVFAEGCPLRCVYCHNPDTWERKDEDLCEQSELAKKIERLYPFIKDGGVTFSGGEPCLQAEFFCELAKELKKKGLHIALDTCGDVYNDKVRALLESVDLVLLDVKMTSEEDYREYTGGSLKKVLEFLDVLESMKKEVWIRHVAVPEINDTEDDIRSLKKLLSTYTCISKVEILPFKDLCREKYKTLGIPFPLGGTPSMSKARAAELQRVIDGE